MTVYSADWVLPIEGEPIQDGAVSVEDGVVVDVGPGHGDEHFDGAVILPGFVNAHSHLEYAVYAGFGDGLPFREWIALHIERKARLQDQDVLAVARLGAAECLRSGVTTIGDASYAGAAAQACAELGVRAIVYLEVFGETLDRFEERRPRVEPWLSDRVALGISPHAPYTCSPDLYRACFELGLPVTTHFAESEPDIDEGLLAAGMVAAHCVHVDAGEIELLAKHDVAVAHCPRSNALLGLGIAPLRELLDAGIRVGLGTDSPASTPSFDLFEELRAAVMAARARARTPDALSAREALELATLGAARALGLDAVTGSLVEGKRADLTVVSLQGSPFLPWEDPAGAVVLGGSPSRVLLTLVDGTERYRRGTTEWHELIAAAQAARSRLLASAPAARPLS